MFKKKEKKKIHQYHRFIYLHVKCIRKTMFVSETIGNCFIENGIQCIHRSSLT